MPDFPAIFKNPKTGEYLYVHNLISCPIGCVRSDMTVEEFERMNAPDDTGSDDAPDQDALEAAANAFKQETKTDPVDETPEEIDEETDEEADAASALKGWAER